MVTLAKCLLIFNKYLRQNNQVEENILAIGFIIMATRLRLRCWGHKKQLIKIPVFTEEGRNV